jgi:hypothetical protein
MPIDDEIEVIVVGSSGKGKEKEKSAWSLIGGEGRCVSCRKDDARCVVNLDAIERWRREFRENQGLTIGRKPPQL